VGVSSAQDQEPTTVNRRPVAEAAFLAALEESHPALRALVGDLGVAEGERLRASLLEDPRLEISREAPEDVERETTWSVAWMLPIDGRRRVSIDAAQAGVDVERHRLERRRFELRLKLRQEYAAWAVGEDQVLLLDEHCGRLEALARWMQSRADAGEESLLAAERMTIAFRSSLVALAEARGHGFSTAAGIYQLCSRGCRNSWKRQLISILRPGPMCAQLVRRSSRPSPSSS
jgi:hypothetical protein